MMKEDWNWSIKDVEEIIIRNRDIFLYYRSAIKFEHRAIEYMYGLIVVFHTHTKNPATTKLLDRKCQDYVYVKLEYLSTL